MVCFRHNIPDPCTFPIPVEIWICYEQLSRVSLYRSRMLRVLCISLGDCLYDTFIESCT
jgi:hypothetical protein